MVITLVILMAASSGCKPIEKIVEIQGEDRIEYRTIFKVDSVKETFRDSIFVKGDTFKLYSFKYKDRLVLRTDTVIKTDSIYVSKEVQLKPTFMQKAKIGGSWFVIGLIVGLFLMFLIRLYLKRLSLR